MQMKFPQELLVQFQLLQLYFVPVLHRILLITLQQLGYKPAEAQRMARDATAPGDDAATIIRKALQTRVKPNG